MAKNAGSNLGGKVGATPKGAVTPSSIEMPKLLQIYPTGKITEEEILIERGYGPIKDEIRLGEGGFGTVVKTTLRGQVVALKRITGLIKMSHMSHVKNEIFISSNLTHENLVRHRDSFKLDTIVYMAMDFVPGGTLHEFLKWKRSQAVGPKAALGMQESEIRQMFRKFLLGLQALHSAGFAHRDVKMGNILCSRDGQVVKLADFGLAKKCYLSVEDAQLQTTSPGAEKLESGLRMMTDWCGTEMYMAPEILRIAIHQDEKIPYNPFASDMFAAGVVFFYMLYFRPPMDFREGDQKRFTRKEIKQTYLYLAARKYNIRKEKEVTLRCQDFFTGLLEPNSVRRYTVAEALHHEWMLADRLAAYKKPTTSSTKPQLTEPKVSKV